MAIYRDSQCVLETNYLVSCWAVNGEGHEDGEYYLHVLLHVGDKRVRCGWGYPSAAARDTAIQAIGALAAMPEPLYEDEETN